MGTEGQPSLGLGWLAGVTTGQPSKRRDIEGVSGTSLMDLQAQLYQAQETARLEKDAGAAGVQAPSRRKAGIDVAALAHRQRNPGVEARDARDRQQLKTGDRTSECYEALERKAALYEKLAHGAADDDDEKYEVDFLAKSVWLTGSSTSTAACNATGPSYLTSEHAASSAQPSGSGRPQPAAERDDEPAPSHRRDASGYGSDPVGTAGIAESGSGGMLSADMAWERERQQRETKEAARNKQEAEEEARRKQRNAVIMSLAKETVANRERTLQSKEAKEQAAQSKIQKLKEEFLKKQLSKALAASGGKSSLRRTVPEQQS